MCRLLHGMLHNDRVAFNFNQGRAQLSDVEHDTVSHSLSHSRRQVCSMYMLHILVIMNKSNSSLDTADISAVAHIAYAKACA